MANTQINMSQTNILATVNMIVVMQGAKKLDAELKGIRGKVAAFKKSMEDSGLKPLDLSGFISGGGLLKPFQDGIKKAIAAQDELAKKAMALKGLKVPKVVSGETSANLAKFNKSLDDISLKIGQALLPAVNGIVTALTPVVTAIGQFAANNPYLVEGLAAAAVAFTVVTVAAMGFATVMGILTSPIGLIAAAIAAAVAIIVIGARLIIDNWASISGFFSGLWTSISADTDVGISTIKQSWNKLGTGMSQTLDRIGTSARTAWEGIKADFFAGASSVVTGTTERFGKLQATLGENWSSASGGVTDFFDRATVKTVAVYEALKSRFNWSPREVMAGIWKSAGSVVTDFWNSATAKTSAVYEALKSRFNWSPKEVMAGVWNSAGGVVTDFWNSVAAKTTAGYEALGSAFSFSPSAMIEGLWQPLAGVFSALWDVLRASATAFMDGFRGLFSGSPVERVTAAWEGLKGYFSGLWTSLTADVQPILDTFGSLFGQSPMEAIKQAWEPILGWFNELWTKLQSLIGPIKNLLGGGVGGLVARITGQPGADGEKGQAPAPSFFGKDIDAPHASSGLPGNLPQHSSALIQQSAANNRTQLEGGLTVRFENAPAGLRTAQPQTNQPGLTLNSRIGYRSLSLGGSNELA
ncbi:phage tail protein [Pseudomonas sp. RT6P73]